MKGLKGVTELMMMMTDRIISDQHSSINLLLSSFAKICSHLEVDYRSIST